jgi:hypothetical protein
MLPFLLFLAQSVPVAHNDLNQSGANTSESRLTPSNVIPGKFGKLCSATITGTSYHQPLYVKGLSVAGGTHDTMIIATMANNVYAVDRATCAILWTLNLGAPWATYTLCCAGSQTYYGKPMGVVGTGVIDANNTLYLVNATTTPSHVLSRINLSTGLVEASVTVAGSVPGTGQAGDTCASGGTLSFCTVNNQQSTSLVLSPDQSKVYFGFGGWEGFSSGEHGWLFAYNTSTLARVGVFCTTPNGYLAVPWMSRGAPSVDAAGNVYVVTGNGDTNSSVSSYAEYVMKFSPTLSLIGTFLNPNAANDNSVDADFGANRFVLIPGTTFGIAAGKDFSVYLINTSTMTQVQTFLTNSGGTPASFTGSYGGLLMNNVLYLPTTTGPLYAFSFSGSSFNTTPLFTTAQNLGSHNGQLSGSANGSSNGILWQVTGATSSFTSNPAGTLRGLNASSGVELWNSDMSGRDALGLISKFAAPTIADGTVMVVTNSGTLVTFGLLSASQLRGNAALRGSAGIR